MDVEPIQSAIKNWMKSNHEIQQKFEDRKRSVLSDPDIKQFLSEHLELDEEAINKNLMKLYEYQSASKNCADCPNLDGCINIVKGYTPHLGVDNQHVSIRYEKCTNKIADEDEKAKEALVRSLYMPSQIKKAKLEELNTDSHERKEVVKAIIHFVQDYSKGNFHKGLYLHGPFGSGKSYILGVVANELKKYNIPSDLIYVPELVREMKSSIKDDSLQAKIDRFKTVPVLMLDDIGAESMSAWFRDEILGSILQHRMMEELPVFFTSNYDLNQLETHLATSNRGDVETIKAGRIVERIRQLSKTLELYERHRSDE